MNKHYFLGICLLFYAHGASAQTLYSNGGTVYVNNGGVLYCNGGITLDNASDLTNQGTITTTKVSTFNSPGNLEIFSNSASAGDGIYYVEQDWINNAQFNAGLSEVHLYGATEQLITSTNGIITTFNDLVLSGGGVAIDRRKTLLDVDAQIASNGTLVLNDRELYTMDNSMMVMNPSVNAITNDLTFDDEGFVSSDLNGYLIWNTNVVDQYIFPVGSSEGVRRYRPVSIKPVNSTNGVYSVRMNNVLADVHGYPLAQKDLSLELLNANFYHSIERSAGSVDAELAIAYDPVADGSWLSIGHWLGSNQKWNEILGTSDGTIGQYNSLLKSDWNFEENSSPYILATTIDQFMVPNVFTPNQDGTNDIYYVTASGLEEFNLTIVNRWGQTMYESDNLNDGWDGTFNGNPCPEGTYFYFIKAKNKQGEIEKQGHLTLNRSN